MDEFSSLIPLTARHLGVADWLVEAHRIARSEVRDPDLAEDIAQTALQKLFDLDTAPRNIPAWLTTAIQRLAIDNHRRKAFRGVDPHGDLDDRAAHGTFSGGVVNRAAIADVLADVPQSQQRALMMSAAGFTNGEIAQELGFGSAASVAATLSRLRRHLRDRKLADDASFARLPPMNQPSLSESSSNAQALPSEIVDRIRQDAPVDLGAPSNWTPVVSFGNQPGARVATVSINPSTKEFVIKGEEMDGNHRRFETLTSLGIESLATADEATVLRVWERCLHYFSGNPYKQWFDPLNSFIKKLTDGANYYDGTACHLDLVQWATKPLWSNLSVGTQRSLVNGDKEFLLWQLGNPVLDIVYLNGGSACTALGKVIQLERRSAVFPNEGTSWYFVRGRVGGARVVGSSPYLQNFHVKAENRQDFLDWVLKECSDDLATMG